MEDIRILLYTDYDYFFNEKPGSPEGGLSDLEAFTPYATNNVVNVRFKLLNRHPKDSTTKQEINGGQKITPKLLADYDEIWVFGRRQNNTLQEPNNELEDAEVAALEKWMSQDGRGVFLTGDHSECDIMVDASSCHEQGHASFLGLGRALGYRIPRAGQLRGWNGPPTNCLDEDLEKRDNYNTNEGSDNTDPCSLDDPLAAFQYDEVPQKIILREKGCVPHRLFWYFYPDNVLRKIDKLPDHTHEGKVLAPTELDHEWPAHSPLPEVAAEGRDKRFPKENRVYKLVVAFDGDPVKIGRIVADSSFHHYLNDNLKGISERDANGLPKPGSDLDKIAHFYGNLALWLAPKTLRDKIKFDVLTTLARHPDVLEARGNSLLHLGKAAQAAAKVSIGLDTLQWLFKQSQFEQHQPLDEIFSVLIGDDSSFLSALLKPEIPLGVVMSACQDFWTERKGGQSTAGDNYAELGQAILGALQKLSDEHLSQFRTLTEKAALSLESD